MVKATGMNMKQKSQFVCRECGYTSAKWNGKCPGCGEWNTMEEETVLPDAGKYKGPEPVPASAPVDLNEVDVNDEPRFSTGFSELDRVLGGGAVRGSVVLVGGEPGIGKSTLLLQICQNLDASLQILYVSGEESARQIRLRADRLGVNTNRLKLYTETNIAGIKTVCEKVNPDFIIIDSIQTMYSPSLNSAPGTVSQVRECALHLMQLAKGENKTVFIVGHVNKEGSIAGPKVLEHMVDCVLSIEGEKYVSYRIVRCGKNRFGSTDEVGVFEMRSQGLAQVDNPSAAMLSGRPVDVPGTCVTCITEGTRPILSEIQALVTPSSFGNARRTASGIEYPRLYLLLAVLEKRAGLPLSGCDAYVNVVGGFHIDEPAADLAVALSIVSSFRDKPLPPGVSVFGELGLTGELRPVGAVSQRLSEISRMGFKKCIMPDIPLKHITVPEGLQIIKCRNITDCIEYCL